MKSYNRFCPVARALDVIGDRWTLLILRELSVVEQARFSDLQRHLPDVASNLLTERLRFLEAQGLIEKHVIAPPTPAKVYRLTEAGKDLRPILIALGQWGLKHTTVQEGVLYEEHLLSFTEEISASLGGLNA